MRKIFVPFILSTFLVLVSFHPVGLRSFKVTKIVIDPDEMTADAYTDNNVFPRAYDGDRFEQFKEGKD